MDAPERPDSSAQVLRQSRPEFRLPPLAPRGYTASGGDI